MNIFKQIKSRFLALKPKRQSTLSYPTSTSPSNYFNYDSLDKNKHAYFHMDEGKKICVFYLISLR